MQSVTARWVKALLAWAVASVGTAAWAAAQSAIAPSVPIVDSTTQPAAANPDEADRFIHRDDDHPTQTSNGADLIGPGQTIQAEGPYQASLDFSISAAYLYGGARGYTQIPKGGANGTSNYNRPQFHSIGINTANIADVELDANWKSYGQFYVGMEYIPLSGSAFIGNKTLTTAGITYPASSRVASDIDLSWYRFGYRYPWVLSTARNGTPDMVLMPYFEVILWTFDYNLTVAKERTANRSFDQLGFQLGGKFVWRPDGGPLSIEATLGSFPQTPNYVTISIEQIEAKYQFYDWNQFQFTGMIGVTWEQQDFQDRQAIDNHVRALFGPMLTAGLQVKF